MRTFLSVFFVMLLMSGQISAQSISVTTDKRFARGATMAFGRMTVKGTDIKETGFCWAETPEPTVDDNKTVKYLSKNGKIYWLQDLTPSTLYYMRAYAVDKEGKAYYGDVIKFYTIPKGTISYTIRDGGADDVKTRIANATKSAVDYWNNLTSITGFSTSVGYEAGVQTADCSYGGWVRVGPNASYQRTGTILHELLHGVGVIPWADTEWSRHNLRASVNGDGYGTGAWLGDRVTEVVRFLANNNTEVLNGDYQHMWPYGINGAHEDDGTEILYIGNGLVCQALGEDGLQHTATSFSRPYYSFCHEDGKKYYIKNESAEFGLYTSYLIPSKSGALVWKTMTAAQAVGNDSAAWTITFTPQNQYYQLKNVATGRYFSYSGAGINGITTSAVSAASSTENFQLMRGRKDIAVGGMSLPQRGYWIIYPESNWSPKCLQANAGEKTSAMTFNISNTADSQRWLILSAEELADVEAMAVDGIKTEIAKALSVLEDLIGVPHTEDVEGVDDEVASTISRVWSVMQTSVDISELNSMQGEIRDATFAFLNGATPLSESQPFDLTYMLVNSGMDSAEGWSVAPAVNHSCGEFYEKTFDMNQILTGMPAGTYQLRAKGFQRPGSSADAWAKYSSGQSRVTAFLYLGSAAQKLNDICACASDTKLGGSESSVGSPVKYIPNDMKSASIYFSRGLYENAVVYENKTKGASLKLGVRTANMPEKYWCIFDDFRLYFFGKTPKEALGIEEVHADGAYSRRSGVYSLDGRIVNRDASAFGSLPKGIYIVNGRKLIK
ncbi:hypothetical protein [Xylanibacter muris]|uniref:Uncharacterized protein n=1 Tax=Xylanibacter muris TaxID=2736290 RepID=A0ABX2AIZ9_9BACT|nr:hypothetical protein [Xylanibacter muris]NPD91069.1 hypothetical protein [Xylanibacter muris]